MRLTDLLPTGAVRVPLAATTKEGVISELVDVLAQTGGVADRQALLTAVLEREHTRTTGIGGGLAIPHGKTAAAGRLLLAIGKPARPVDFDSVDGKPVSLVVLLVAPPEQMGQHIQALAHIAGMMSIDQFRNKVIAAPTAEDVRKLIELKEAELERG